MLHWGRCGRSETSCRTQPDMPPEYQNLESQFWSLQLRSSATGAI